MAPAPAAAAAAGLGGRVRVREREIDTIAGSCMNRNRTETERVARNRFVQFKAGERNEKKSNESMCQSSVSAQLHTYTNTRYLMAKFCLR